MPSAIEGWLYGMCGSAAILTALCSTRVSRHDATGSHLAQLPASIRRADAQRLQSQADGLASLVQDAGTRRLNLPHSCSSMLSISCSRLCYSSPISRLRATGHDTDPAPLHGPGCEGHVRVMARGRSVSWEKRGYLLEERLGARPGPPGHSARSDGSRCSSVQTRCARMQS